MRTTAALCAAFCIYHQVLFVAGNERNDGSDSRQFRRTAREVGAPAAVDCKMSPWSEWSPCDPCSKLMYRSRSVEAFGQFKGQVCSQPLGDRRTCRPDRVCEEQIKPQCSNTEFQCESGMCIKKRLQCNGDNDCGDFSDEDICEEVKRTPCGKLELELSELGRTAGYGINILGSDPRSNAFNNEFFNGLCSRVRDTNTLEYHRIPWNVATLNYATLADESFSKELYDDSSTLLKEVLQETKQSLNLGFSFKFTTTEESTNDSTSNDSNLKFENQKTESIKQLTEYSSVKHKTFMRVKGKIQLSTFRMRSRDLMLTETFQDDVAHLPVEYMKGEYFRFLEDYGTHYAMSGKSGGEYELVYVINKETMTTKQITEQKIHRCLNLDASINIQEETDASGLDANIKREDCEDVNTNEEASGDKKALIDKVVTSVSGGTAATAASLKMKIEKSGILDVEAYVEWAKSLINAPVLLHSQPEAIHSLIPLNMPHGNTKKENLERATEDYIAEYSVCKCQPCQNGGTVTLVDGQCLCLCAPQFEGLACQTVKSSLLRDPNIIQEGNWNCWSPWSACSGGRRSRTRTCNTNGLSGASCKGETVSSDYC